MKPWQIFKLILAVLSLTDILVYQKVAAPVRSFFGFIHDEDGNALETKDTGSWWRNFFGEALTCFRCTSVWVAILLVLVKKIPGYTFVESVLISSWMATFFNRKSF